MVYVALLRGVNVGGKNAIAMPRLRAAFEAAGMTSVRTYINSGNVIFEAPERDRAGLAASLERCIAERLGVNVGVLVRDIDEMRRLVEAIPATWANDEQQRCDVAFLWPEADRAPIIEELGLRLDIEDALYVPGALVRRVDRANQSRSGLLRVFGTRLYAQMTLRNCNTARKLLALMEDAG